MHGRLGVALILVLVFVLSQWDRWRREHQRHARLEAYRRRHQWRRADMHKLRKLGVPEHRIQRMIGDAKRRGRGVVHTYQSLDEMAAATAEQLDVLLAPETQPHIRLAILRQTPFCRYIIEALYRGEHAAAKDARQTAASTYAEHIVANSLGISAAKVRKVCVSVRKERKQETAPSDDGLLLRVWEIEAWKRDGNLCPS